MLMPMDHISTFPVLRKTSLRPHTLEMDTVVRDKGDYRVSIDFEGLVLAAEGSVTNTDLTS